MAYSILNGLTIQYNHINLPGVVDSDEGSQKVHYSLGGSKILTVNEYTDPLGGPSTELTRMYFMGLELEYEGIGSFSSTFTPKSYQFGDGRLLFDGSDIRKQYYLHDHLGNVVVVFEDKNNDGILEETSTPSTNEVPNRYHYYSFGMQWDLGHTTVYIPPDYSEDNRYEYNGKEYETIAQLLDYGWRWYDPVIGRWNGVDPLAEKYASISPYAYVANNPIILIDPDGREIIIPFRGVFTSRDAQKVFASQVINALHVYSNDSYQFNSKTNTIQIKSTGDRNTDKDFSANTARIASLIGTNDLGTVTEVIPTKGGSYSSPKFEGAASNPEYGSDVTVGWNPENKHSEVHHELIHANFANRGERLQGDSNVPIPEQVSKSFQGKTFLPNEELRARQIENEEILGPAGENLRPIPAPID